MHQLELWHYLSNKVQLLPDSNLQMNTHTLMVKYKSLLPKLHNEHKNFTKPIKYQTLCYSASGFPLKKRHINIFFCIMFLLDLGKWFKGALKRLNPRNADYFKYLCAHLEVYKTLIYRIDQRQHIYTCSWKTGFGLSWHIVQLGGTHFWLKLQVSD